METIEAQLEAYAGTLAVLKVFGLAFLLAVVSETLWDVITGQRKRLGETATNFTITIVTGLLERTAYGLVFIVALIIVGPLAITQIPHLWWSWALALIVADFTYYWMHRCEHRIRLFWANHSTHHHHPNIISPPPCGFPGWMR